MSRSSTSSSGGSAKLRRYGVTLTPEAESDLAAIRDYVSVTLGMPAAARRRLRDLREAVASLESMPARNRVLDGRPWEGLGVRRLTSGGMCIYYHVDDEAGEVRVLGVLPAGAAEALVPARLGG